MNRKNPRLRRHLVHEGVRRDIIGGVFPSGTVLSESEIAKNYNISRTPVREALIQLQEEGFVKIVPHRGPVVHVPTPRELYELFLVRDAIEGLVVRVAAEAMSPAELEKLHAEWNHLDENLTPETRDRTYAKCAEFHLALAEGTKSEIIKKALLSIRDRIMSARQIYMADQGHPTLKCLKTYCNEHLRIVEALQERNASRGEKIMKQHLARLYDDMLEVATQRRIPGKRGR